MHKIKSLLLASATLALAVTAMAQDKKEEEMNVILPPEAMSCNLPAAPARIPEDADYDHLVKSKGEVNKFQADLQTYRDCLHAAEDNNSALTEGNKVALTQAYNYSVEMETRVADQFNEAVRNYKARKAAAAGDSDKSHAANDDKPKDAGG